MATANALQKGSDTTDGSGDCTVTFGTEFAAAPLVFLQGVDAASKGIVLDVVSKSTTQVVVKARKVTGITSGTGTSHRHSFSDSFNTSYVSAGTPSGSISSVSAGTPSGTVSSHSHLNQGGPSSTVLYGFSGTWTGRFTAEVLNGPANKSHVALGTAARKDMPRDNHTHVGSTGNTVPTFSGSAMGTHGHTFTGSAMGTHRHSGTASGNTGYESSHTHSVAAPVLAIDFDWLAVKA